jgi:hypothetical protein
LAGSIPLLPETNQLALVDRTGAVDTVVDTIFCHSVPVLKKNDPTVESYTNNPFVFGIASRPVVLTRGIRIPLLKDFISSIALGLAVEPSSLIATFWAKLFNPKKKDAHKRRRKKHFFICSCFND